MEKVIQEKKSTVLLSVALISMALAIRILLLHISSFDIDSFEGVWYDTFIKIGRIDAFKEVFFNYSPPLLYLIDITTLFRFIPKEIAIKLISVVFDFFAAIAIYKIIALKYSNIFVKWLGFYSLLFLPTVFIESGMWGQSDIIYTSFLLWTLYFLFKRKNVFAVLSFAIAFSFKMQAVFFGPIFLILILQKKYPIWHLLLIPVVYFVSIVPAWLAGGPLKELLLIYFSQFDSYHALSMRGPNLYQFIPTDPGYEIKVLIGMIVTFLFVGAYMVIRWLKWKDNQSITMCFDTAFLMTMIPFLLPKMHERYFVAGGVFLLLLVFFEPKTLWIAIMSQASSLLAFVPYFTGWSDIFAKIGAIFNVFVVIGLILCLKEYICSAQNQEFFQKEIQTNP
jgi:Gpi18-like mannosyltransferase